MNGFLAFPLPPEFADGHLVTTESAGLTWFSLPTVTEVLRDGDAEEAARMVDPDDQREIPIEDHAGKRRMVRFVNVYGLFTVISRSTNCHARSFRKWILSVVLPRLRTASLEVVNVAPGSLKSQIAEAVRLEVRAYVAELLRSDSPHSANGDS